MDTNMDAMSGILLHMRQQLSDSHQQIALLNEENARLKTMCQSTAKTLNTPNGTNHTDSSSTVSTITNNNNNTNKLSQKRPHPSTRTTQNIATTNKIKTTTNLYDTDENKSSPLAPSSLNETMDVESNTLTSTTMNSTTTNSTTNNNEHSKRTTTLENGINVRN